MHRSENDWPIDELCRGVDAITALAEERRDPGGRGLSDLSPGATP